MVSNIDAEAGVLSGMMVDANTTALALESVEVDDFSKHTHQLIFNAIEELFNDNIEIDVITLSDKLKNKGQIDAVGGTAFINILSDVVMSGANLEHHINILKKKREHRELIKISKKAILKAENGDDDVLDDTRDKLSNIGLKHTNYIFTAQNSVIGAMKQTDYIHTNKVQVGLQTDIYNLNHNVLFKKGNLVIVAAKKSVGKSALMNQFAFFNIRKGSTGAFFSLEMDEKSMVNREISRIGKIDYADISMGRLNKEQLLKYQTASEEIAKYKFMLSTQRGLTLQQIKSILIRMKNKLGKLDLVVIDYIQKIKTPKGHSRQRELADASEEIGTMAQHFDCPFFVGSQVNHEGVTREAEDLENDADIVLKLRRPKFEYNSKFNKSGHSEPDCADDYATLQITKNRNGKTGGIELRSMLEFQRFENWEKVY